MGVSWTKEQQQVIDLRKRNILVSAAAGSGKTAVLVERISKMITDKEHPVDIDHLLIVTFTNAAAAEMRERIGAAIEKALDENPLDEHLQRQLTLIHNAQITTIDSFCLYVIRNHFHEIDLEPNFRIGDEGELKLLKEDVLAKVLEDNYVNLTPNFRKFVEGYASGRNDAAISGMILQLYEFSKSYPWPIEWLDLAASGYDVADVSQLDAAEWMKPLVSNIKNVLEDIVAVMEQALDLTLDNDGPYMYEKAVRSDLEKYKSIAAKTTFSEFYVALENITYDRLASSKNFAGKIEKLEQVKELRESAKDAVKKLCRQYFFCSPGTMVEQLQFTGPMVAELVRLTKEFSESFALEKRNKNLVDFHDLEHFALEILVDEKTKEVRKTAEEFRDTFEEIMIDEYQDSNQVQETILRAISRESRGENNVFMVGDVKQSIYRFRLARPELFMEKYDTYSLEESTTQRIDLHKNFRSRYQVLTCTNDIFYRIMARDLGNVEYDSKAALYPGASFVDTGQFEAEILLVDSEEEILEDTEYTDKKLLEAKMVAEKIKKMMKSQQVTDKKTGELRPIRYSDIVILLRSLNGWADQFVKVLNDSGIPAHSISSTGYFSAIEVQTVLCMLRILDNPRQDIPLAAILRSPIGNLTDEEIATLRLDNPEVPFHQCILELCQELEDEKQTASDVAGSDKRNQAKELSESRKKAEEKLHQFYELYKQLRKLVPDTPIHELIEQMLKVTGYANYVAAMPAGTRRQANLNMLLEKAIAYENTSYKGLFHFVRYIDELQKYDVDYGEADMVGENEEVVRIMSIHKSKGLEFPVVFVSGMGKNFNKQDVRSKMVLHPDFGIGLDYMDGDRRIKAPTIAKKAIAKQIDLENLGEELRVLYVALTRAKEKLILTGNLKKANGTLEQLRMNQQVESYKKASSREKANRDNPVSSVTLPYMIRESARTYFDWVLPALLFYEEKYKIEVTSAEELVTEEITERITEEVGKEQRLAEISNADENLVKELDARFSLEYPYQIDVTRKNKYSVSELKHRAMRELFEQEQEDAVPAYVEDEKSFTSYIPRFMQEDGSVAEEINQGALRGTAVHRVMECYDFASMASPKQQIQQMLMDGAITEDMKKLVKISLVEAFLADEVGKRMAAAQKTENLYREKPFVMGFTEKELEQFGFGETETKRSENSISKTKDSEPLTSQVTADKAKIAKLTHEEDLTLIQGIIDVFWIEEDGITLLDYKTDRVDTPQELADRYRAQLNLYEEALNRVFADRGISVKEKLLYSFRFGMVIPVE